MPNSKDVLLKIERGNMAIATHEETREVIDNLITQIDELKAYKTAYEHIKKSIVEVWGDYIKEGEAKALKCIQEPVNVKLTIALAEITAKIETMRMMSCFIERSLERAKGGEI